MCAAGHAWVGLGRIVYATSSAQLSEWRAEWGGTAVAGGAAADHDGRPGCRRRRARARVRRRHEGPVRGEVPAMTGSSRKRSSATEPAWVQHAIWWQVYPLGFVGAFPADPPPTADEHRLRRIIEWLDHAIELGASGIALGPMFDSRTHGYDTTDHYRIDPGSVTTPTSTSWSPKRTGAACGYCSTACSTTSGPTFPLPRRRRRTRHLVVPAQQATISRRSRDTAS